MTTAAAATIKSEPTAKLTPAQLLRRVRDGAISLFGVRFHVCHLSDGWAAVAYVSGDSQPDSDIWSDLPHADSYWPETLARIQEGLADPSSQRLHKSSTGSRVAQLPISLPAGDAAEVICKQGRVDTVTQRLGSWLKGPKEWREFWLGHRLRQLGLPTPLPLACLWRRAGFFHLEDRIVTEFITDALPLDRAIRKLNAARENHRRSHPLDSLMHRMADVLRTLGDNRLYHRDLKVSNVLVSHCESDPQPWLIDLDGVGTESEPHGPRFRRTLARLAASLSESTDLTATQHLRALKRLAGKSGRTKDAWKANWKTIQSVAARMNRKQRRSTRDIDT